jgi:Domain of unknown function (DUF397)
MVGPRELNEATWRKSKRSGDSSSTGCVSVAVVGSYGAIRDSKNPELAAIVISMATLRRLVREVKRGALDLR